MLRSILFAVGFVAGQAYSSGTRDCQTVNHGTFKTSLPTDWTLSLLDSTGTAVTSWSAGQTYTAQIQATSTSFKGWSWAPLKGTPTSFPSGSANMAGSFTAGDSYSHSNTGCPGSITQTSASSRTVIKATWTPPVAGAGTVSLWSLMVISKNGNNYNAVLTVPEAGSGGPSATGTGTGTGTGTATGSKGASASVTSTETASPPIRAGVSPSSVAVAIRTVVTGASPLPANTSIMAVAVGSGLGGIAVAVAFAGVVMLVRRRQPKKIMQFTPTVVTVSPLKEAIPNPYI